MTIKGKTDPDMDRALEREFEALLAVDPPRDLEARVRARIAREDAPGRWGAGWIFTVAAGALAAAAIAAVLILQPRETTQPAQTRNAEVSPVTDSTPALPSAVPPKAATTKPVRNRQTPKVESHEPELLIAANEAAALRRLLTGPPLQLAEDFQKPVQVNEVHTPAIVIEPINVPAPIVIEPIELPAAAEQAGRE